MTYARSNSWTGIQTRSALGFKVHALIDHVVPICERLAHLGRRGLNQLRQEEVNLRGFLSNLVAELRRLRAYSLGERENMECP